MRKSVAPYGLAISLLLLGVMAVYWQRHLPLRVAAHFDVTGAPDSWMSAQAFTVKMIAFGLFMPGLIVGLAWLIRLLPPSLLNVPRAQFWRQPENHAPACRYFMQASLWMGTAYVVWIGALFHLIVQANQVSPPQLDAGKVVMLAIALLIAALTWIACLLRFFWRTGRKEG